MLSVLITITTTIIIINREGWRILLEVMSVYGTDCDDSFIKLFILNTYNFLYVNYTSIKWLKSTPTRKKEEDR